MILRDGGSTGSPPPQDERNLANPERGEAALCVGARAILLRPTFQALVAAEGELGSLFALVERAAEGRLTVGEVATLFWHCRNGAGAVSRDEVGELVAAAGLARVAPVLKRLLQQILQGAAV